MHTTSGDVQHGALHKLIRPPSSSSGERRTSKLRYAMGITVHVSWTALRNPPPGACGSPPVSRPSSRPPPCPCTPDHPVTSHRPRTMPGDCDDIAHFVLPEKTIKRLQQEILAGCVEASGRQRSHRHRAQSSRGTPRPTDSHRRSGDAALPSSCPPAAPPVAR